MSISDVFEICVYMSQKKHPSKKYSNAIKICNLVFEIHFYFHNEKENEQKRNQFMTDSEGI